MNAACRSFRALLEQKLVGRPDPHSLRTLSWHEHLLGCGACRALLQDEEALETLLATLPEPKLAPDVKRRVLVALARARANDAELDRLLELDPGLRAPAGLARGVLARLADERRRLSNASATGTNASTSETGTAASAEAGVSTNAPVRAATPRTPQPLSSPSGAAVPSEAANEAALAHARDDHDPLDRLLERAGAVTVPPALAARVLRELRDERRPRRRLTLVRHVWGYAAAAALVATLTTWAVWPRPDERPTVVDVPPRGTSPRDGERNGDGIGNGTGNGTGPVESQLANAVVDTEVALAPDPQMLAAFDALENWELLVNEKIDVSLSTLTPADEVLIEFEEGG